METCVTRVRIITKAIRLFSLAAACLLAQGAWADYVQLPMIEADGAQLVPTDFKLESSDIIEVKFKTGSDVSTTQNIFCNRGGANKNTFTAFLLSGAPCWHYGSTQHAKNADKNVTANTIYVTKCNGATGEWWVNGVEQENPQTPETFVPGGPLAFFSSYSSGDATGTGYNGGNNNAEITFYYAKVWASGGTELKHHLVPAYDTAFSDAKKKFGLLDIVPTTPVFYENVGSRVFKWVGDGNIVWTGATSTLISDSANWFGDSGSMVFVSDAVATLASDWTAALGDGKMKMKEDGAKVTLDIGAANTLSLTNHFYVGANDATVEIVSGTVTNVLDQNFYIGNEGGAYSGATLEVEDAALVTKGSVVVGNGGGASDNAFVAKGGASVYANMINVGVNVGTNNLFLVQGGAVVESYSGFEIGTTSGTNNEFRVTGSGTKFTQSATASVVSYIGKGANSVSNRFVVADGALAVFNRILCIGTGSSYGNLFRVESGGIVTNANVFLGHNNGAKYGECARAEVVGEGSEWKTAYFAVINGTDDAQKSHECFVGKGGTLNVNNSLSFVGNGNRLVVDDATVNIGASLFTTNTQEGVTGASGTTIKIGGARASITCNQLNGADASFEGSEVIEFVIPEDGWATAPFTPYFGFKIPSGVTLRIDADSVKAYLRAHPSGGTVPLMQVRRSGSTLTVEDLAALSANLPSNCELVNDSGVLSCRIKAPGLTIIFK